MTKQIGLKVHFCYVCRNLCLYVLTKYKWPCPEITSQERSQITSWTLHKYFFIPSITLHIGHLCLCALYAGFCIVFFVFFSLSFSAFHGLIILSYKIACFHYNFIKLAIFSNTFSKRTCQSDAKRTLQMSNMPLGLCLGWGMFQPIKIFDAYFCVSDQSNRLFWIKQEIPDMQNIFFLSA